MDQPSPQNAGKPRAVLLGIAIVFGGALFRGYLDNRIWLYLAISAVALGVCYWLFGRQDNSN